MRGKELLLKHIHEELTPAERFELEKIAIEDDFVAEAWEGLSSGQFDSEAILLRLQKRLTGPTSGRVVPFRKKVWPYAVAASIMLITATLLLLRQSPNTGVSTVDLEVDNPAKVIAMDIPNEKEEFTGAETERVENQKLNTDDDAIQSNDPRSISREVQSGQADKKIQVRKPIDTENLREDDQARQANTQVSEALVVTENKTEDGLDQIPKELKSDSDKSLALSNHSEMSRTMSIIADPAPSENDQNQVVNRIVRNKSDLSNDITSTKMAESRQINTPALKVATQGAAEPLIGFEEWRKIILENSQFTSEDFLRSGLTQPVIVTLTFSLDDMGNPVEIQVINAPEQIGLQTVELFKKGGGWKSDKLPITYNFNVPVRN